METVGRVTRVILVVNILGAGAIGLAGPTLLVLLYGSRFAPAVTPFLILLVEAVVTSAARTLAQAFSGSGRPGMSPLLRWPGWARALPPCSSWYRCLASTAQPAPR